MTTTELLARIDRFKAATGMSDTAIGLSSVKDGKFVAELRAGRRCWPETMERVLAFITRPKRKSRAA